MFFGNCFTRFLDDNDADIQMSVLECLVLSNDYLLPHRHRLENLIKSKKLREELTNWNFSKDIDEAHRSHFVSLVIRIIMPKVRSLKNSASREVHILHTFSSLLHLVPYIFVVVVVVSVQVFVTGRQFLALYLSWMLMNFPSSLHC